MPFDLHQLPLWANLAVFVVAGVAVWLSGARLSQAADTVADLTDLDKALLGAVMLAGITELPELTTTCAAGLFGDARLAVGNIFGGVTMQTAVLALADVAVAAGALTRLAARPVLMLQASLLILLLGATIAALQLGDTTLFAWLGTAPLALFVAAAAAFALLQATDASKSWRPADESDDAGAGGSGLSDARVPALVRTIAVSAATILVAGVVLARAGEVLAEQTGLGSTFVGASLLAAATSLPELSTTVAAVRIGSYTMAVANIFGSNMIMVALLLPADIATTAGPVLADADPGAIFALAAGIVVTCVFLIGMVVRSPRTIARMGIDSWVVAVVYPTSLVGLYALR